MRAEEPSAPAADRLAGQTIEAVELVGLESLSEDTLLFYLGLRVGDRFDPATLNQKVHELWRKGLVDDLAIEASPLDWGVRVRVVVRERPVLGTVDYLGIDRIRRSELEERLEREDIRVREGEPLEIGELRRVEAVIEQLYAERGFWLAQVGFNLEAVSPTKSRVVFTVDEGDRVRVRRIDFEGNTVFADARLRWAMKRTKVAGPLARLRKKDRYDPAALEQDLQRVAELYRRAGYKDVVVGDPRLEIVIGRPEAARIERQRRRLAITVPIEEGDRWRLGGISLEGNQRFSDELLLRQFDRPRGGWLRSDVIDAGVVAVEELYRNSGHLLATVEPRTVERDHLVADVFVRIEEGEQFRIGRIEFEGNTKTKDEVLRRELAVQEGAIVDTRALRASLLRLEQLRFFEVDDEDPVEFAFHRDEQTVDLKIQGEEGEPSDLLLSGGFSETHGFFGQVLYRDRNFLGRGETLQATVEAGERQDVLELSYLIPWWLGRRQQLGFSLFQRDLEFELLSGQEVVQERSGGSLTYGRRLGLFGDLSATWMRYDSEETATDLTDPDNPVFLPIDRKVSMLRLGFVEDRRDSRLQPTRGGRWSAGIDWAGGALGGSTAFVRPQASFSRYLGLTRQPLKSLFAFNLEAGYIAALGGDELFYSDRFYLGGENSVRGFEYRSIWVRDETGATVRDENRLALGGDRSLQLNLEYHLLLGGPFRLLAFVDGGKVWGADQPLDFDHLRLSTGLELQIKVPILGAPLRFIWAENLDPLPDDRFQSFQVSIGPSF